MGELDKEDKVYTQNGLLSHYKKEKFCFAICNNMEELKGILLSETRVRKKDKYL